MRKTIKMKTRGGALGMAGLGLVLSALPGAAQAQDADRWVELGQVDGVASVRDLGDGRVEVTLDDGRIVVLEEGQFSISGETVYVLASQVEALLAADVGGISSTVLLGGLGLLGAGGLAVAASGGDDTPAPPPDGAPNFSSASSADVTENSTAVLTVSAADPEGAAVTYSISGGADEALFAIDASTGALTFANAPDFETPGDADGDNVYDVVVTASDGTNTASQAIAVTVTNENDNDPVFSSGTMAGADENATATDYVAAADDADGDTISYSIEGGADAALFVIDATTGALSLAAGADFEAPNDADGDGVYEVVIGASDGTTTVTQTVSVTLANVDEDPAFTSGATGSFDENQLATDYVAVASDPEGGNITYSLGTGGDSALFAIDAATGVVSLAAVQNFEFPGDGDADGDYEIDIIATDAGGNAVSQTVTLSIADVNEAPALTLEQLLVDENATNAGTVTADDPDGDALTYSIVGGADAAAFTINASTGQLDFVAAPDFEAPADANTDNVYIVEVQVADPDGLESSAQIAVIVSDVNDNDPVIGSANSATVDENVTGVVLDVDASDADAGTTITYSIVGGADAADFTIDAATGEVSFIASPDFENPDDADGDNVYEIEVAASDGDNQATQSVMITVNDRDNEFAPVVTSPTSANIDENDGGTILTVTATDGDPSNGGFSFAVTGGADAALFQVDSSTGALSFVNPQDADSPNDADGDGVYDVIVSVTDQPALGAPRTSDTAISVTVDNLDDEAPEFTSGNAGTAAENGTATGYVAFAENTDGAQSSVTYSLGSPGAADQALFAIDAVTGALSFLNAPDFENPTDANGDNVYEVEIIATDASGNTDAQFVEITVTDENDVAPVVTSAGTANFDENDTGVAYTATASDADTVGGPISYSLGGADAALFTIDAATGEVRFISPPDFENPSDGNGDNVYDLVIEASDGVNTGNQPVSITVNDRINEAPPVVTSPAAFNVDEDETGGQLVGTVTATDADPGNGGFTFAIIGGADASLFTINSTTGELEFASGVDFENPSDSDGDGVYEVNVEVSDQPASGAVRAETQSISVTVDNIDDEAPQIAQFGTGSAAEGQTSTDYVAAAVNDDGDQSTVRYSIGGGQDQALFTVDPITGALSFINAPDFENPADQNGDNEYLVTVRAEDASGFNRSQNLVITVTDENDTAPVVTSGSIANALENDVSTGYTPTATDADTVGGPITFSIGAGGDDSALFDLDPTTGELVFKVAPDFENPQDSGTNNTYEVEIIASDGVNQTSQGVVVTVGDANDNAPTVTSGSAVSVAENETDTGYTATASDVDTVGTITYAISGGADASLFTIDANTGELSFVSGRDFEAPTDADTDNVYEVEITANDGVNDSAAQAVSVTVTDVDPEVVLLSELGNLGVILAGPNNNGRLEVGAAGDLDGDGIDDLFTGHALFASGDGALNITYGQTAPLGAPSAAPGAGNYRVFDVTADTILTGDNSDANSAGLGNSMLLIGDRNGDGIADYAFETGGNIYVHLAGISGIPTNPPQEIDAYFGAALSGAEGFRFDGAGFPRLGDAGFDFDGDGLDDFIIIESGAPRIIYGATSVITQSSGSGARFVSSSSVPNTTIAGTNPVAGDFNGDGIDDIVSNGQSGNLVVFLGNGNRAVNLPGNANNFRFVNGDNSQAIDFVGDINGDGFDDFAVARTTSLPNSLGGNGIVSVFFGDTSTADRDIQNDASFTIEVPAGFSITNIVHGIGDFDGDGFDDIAIVLDDGSEQRVTIVSGDAAIGSGGTVDASTLPGLVFDVGSFSTVGANFIKSVGDVNGDGIEDIAISASNSSFAGASNQTNAVLLYGQAAAQTAVSLTGSSTTSRDVLIGTSQDDVLNTVGGGDLLIGGGGNDALFFQATGAPGASVARFEGGAGTDGFGVVSGSLAINLTDSTFGSAAPVDFSFESVERLTLGGVNTNGSTNSGNVIVDIDAVTRLLGENIGGTRTLVVDFGATSSELIIADSADWTQSGQTTFEGTVYNVFTHTSGAQIYAESGAGNDVLDANGVDFKGPNQSAAPGQVPASVGREALEGPSFEIDQLRPAFGLDQRGVELIAPDWEGSLPMLGGDALNEIREVLADGGAMIRVGDMDLPMGAGTASPVMAGALAMDDAGDPWVVDEFMTQPFDDM